jgi:hypothetical protein
VLRRGWPSTISLCVTTMSRSAWEAPPSKAGRSRGRAPVYALFRLTCTAPICAMPTHEEEGLQLTANSREPDNNKIIKVHNWMRPT